MENNSNIHMTDFPREVIIHLHLNFAPAMVDERIAYLDSFVEDNKNRMSQDFLDKQVNGHKALLYYQGEKYLDAAVYYTRSAEKSSPEKDILYFHEHCMVARCYRLAKQYAESEAWIMKAYAQKGQMSNVFELFDLLKDYVDLLNDTNRDLPVSYQEDIETVIAEAGMEVALNGDDLKQTVVTMKKMNHDANLQLSRIAAMAHKPNENPKQELEKFIAGCRIRYYRELAAEQLQGLKE